MPEKMPVELERLFRKSRVGGIDPNPNKEPPNYAWLFIKKKVLVDEDYVITGTDIRRRIGMDKTESAIRDYNDRPMVHFSFNGIAYASGALRIFWSWNKGEPRKLGPGLMVVPLDGDHWNFGHDNLEAVTLNENIWLSLLRARQTQFHYQIRISDLYKGRLKLSNDNRKDKKARKK